MESNEIKALVVELCQNVVTNLSDTHKVEKEKMKVRIDMKDLISKPVFGLFNQSSFLVQCNMKEIIEAGGGKGASMVVGVYVQDIISNIFSKSLTFFEIENTRQMFILLTLKNDIPIISIYKDGVFMDAVPVEDFIQVEI